MIVLSRSKADLARNMPKGSSKIGACGDQAELLQLIALEKCTR
jgi:hypothetical protein